MPIYTFCLLVKKLVLNTESKAAVSQQNTIHLFVQNRWGLELSDIVTTRRPGWLMAVAGMLAINFLAHPA